MSLTGLCMCANDCVRDTCSSSNPQASQLSPLPFSVSFPPFSFSSLLPLPSTTSPPSPPLPSPPSPPSLSSTPLPSLPSLPLPSPPLPPPPLSLPLPLPLSYGFVILMCCFVLIVVLVLVGALICAAVSHRKKALPWSRGKLSHCTAITLLM